MSIHKIDIKPNRPDEYLHGGNAEIRLDGELIFPVAINFKLRPRQLAQVVIVMHANVHIDGLMETDVVDRGRG